MTTSTRCAVAGTFLMLALAACAPPSKTGAPGSAPAQVQPAKKEVCEQDADCAPYFRCTSDHHCRCQLDADCVATQACRAGLCLPR